MPADVVAGHRALLKGRALDAGREASLCLPPRSAPIIGLCCCGGCPLTHLEAFAELLLAFGPLPEGAGLVRGVKDVVSNDWEGDAANSGTSVTTDCRKMQVAMS